MLFRLKFLEEICKLVFLRFLYRILLQQKNEKFQIQLQQKQPTSPKSLQKN